MNSIHIRSAVLSLAASMLTAAAGAATVGQMCVRQMWPWHEKVRIDYTLEGNAGETADINVTIRDAGGAVLRPVDSSFSGDLLEVAPGEHVIWWDPSASGLDLGNTALEFTLAAEADAQRYCVIDISVTNEYAVSYRETPPAGGWNTDEYKTTKMVFRHVKAGSFLMGTPEGEEGRRTATEGNMIKDMTLHNVTLSHDYWLGIFPLTYKQASIVNGATLGATGTYVANQKDASPAVRLSVSQIIGWAGTSDASWYGSPVPREGSWLYKLNAGIVSGALPDGTHLAIPTEAQWECACRAGTTSAYGNGTDSIEGIGPTAPNRRPMYPVGGFSPNAWGFYDMHGCVWQWTVECYSAYNTGDAAVTDPFYPLSSTQIWPALRGGSYGTSGTPTRDNRSGTRRYMTYSNNDSSVGVRIAIVKAP